MKRRKGKQGGRGRWKEKRNVCLGINKEEVGLITYREQPQKGIKSYEIINNVKQGRVQLHEYGEAFFYIWQNEMTGEKYLLYN